MRSFGEYLEGTKSKAYEVSPSGKPSFVGLLRSLKTDIQAPLSIIDNGHEIVVATSPEVHGRITRLDNRM